MDYVVFGTGYGATLMLLGWILRTFGPDFRYRVADGDDLPGGDFLLGRISWRRFSAGLGTLLATIGMAFVLATFILILVNPSTRAGTWTAAVLFALTLVAAGVWSWLYVSRYGTFGIVPERGREDDVFRVEPAPAPAAVAAKPGSAPVAGPVLMPATASDEAGDAAQSPEALVAAPNKDESDEHRIRMSRYQGHGPEDREADEPGDDDGADLADEDTEVNAEDEAADDGVDEAEAPDEDTGDLPAEIEDEPAGDEDVADEAPDVADATADEPDQLPDATVEAVRSTDAPDDDGAGAEVDAPADAHRLEDTPEGRAEALRRIQAWEPDDPYKA